MDNAIKFENGMTIKFPGTHNADDCVFYPQLNTAGKQYFDRLLSRYPEGVERDRMVFGVWADANPTAEHFRRRS